MTIPYYQQEERASIVNRKSDQMSLTGGTHDGNEIHMQANKGEKTKTTNKEVVFRTRSSYDILIFLLLSLAPIATLGSSISLFYNDADTTEEEKHKAYRALFWITISILLLYALVLPMHLEIRSDASLGICTCLGITWNFSHITAAYENPSIMENWYRPRFKFATKFTRGRVLVHRRQGGWDVLVTPKDVDGFIKAVWDVAANVEGEGKGQQC